MTSLLDEFLLVRYRRWAAGAGAITRVVPEKLSYLIARDADVVTVMTDDADCLSRAAAGRAGGQVDVIRGI